MLVQRVPEAFRKVESGIDLRILIPDSKLVVGDRQERVAKRVQLLLQQGRTIWSFDSPRKCVGPSTSMATLKLS